MKPFLNEKINKIYKEIKSKNVHNNNLSTQNDNENKSNFSIHQFYYISEEELCIVIKGMADKSCGYDPIPMWLLKQCLSELKGLILMIVNKSLTEVYFPKSLKSAVVKLTLKKSNLDKDDCCNSPRQRDSGPFHAQIL